MTDMTIREQMYRRWKRGENYFVLAKEMGVTRERMRIILTKMDDEVPLVDRIEELEAKLAKLIGGAETVIEEWRTHINKGSWFKVSMDEAMYELRADVAEAKGAIT
jgi:hypothetical protein